MNRNLGYGSVVTAPIQATAAGTTTLNGNSQYIGAGSFSGVRYTCLLGALASGTSGTYLKAQGSNDNATWTDIASSHVGPLSTGQAAGNTLVLDMYRVGFAYVRPVVVRPTSDAIQAVIADLYLPMIEPVTPDATNAGTNVLAYPQAGTA